jgi:hypothetical protein
MEPIKWFVARTLLRFGWRLGLELGLGLCFLGRIILGRIILEGVAGALFFLQNDFYAE